MIHRFFFEPPLDFIDPRELPDFEPKHWPRCNGGESASPNSTSLHDRRCIEFLTAYYKLNVLNGQLERARSKNSSSKAVGTLRRLRTVATRELERLEDRYSPIGFYSEPSMEGVYYNSIGFNRPETPRLPAPDPETAGLKAHFTIPGLENIPESELTGPVRTIRFRHGNVHL